MPADGNGSQTPAMTASEPLLQLLNVSHHFTLPTGKRLAVLADINVTLRAGELVALLGPSGCGKSTLIRIAAGLIRATEGEVCYRGHPVVRPDPAIALVFQQVALFPWLTVAQNIEQALIARGAEPAQRRQRVAEVVGLIGLEGFEEAYPRELSGGMKQRVGIARALAVQPEILCMDEPFSQLDALTAETLRDEVVSLWEDRQKYPSSVLLVSHDIHEVAFMASRILIMTAHPGRIQTVLENPLPYPRDPHSAAYQALVDRLHGIITGLYLPEQEVGAPPQVVRRGEPGAMSGPITPIPLAGVREILGLLDAVQNRQGDVSFFSVTAELDRAFTRIVLAVKAAELLGFLQTPEDRLVLTELGRQFIAAPVKVKRQIFRGQILPVPLIRRLKEMLGHSAEQTLRKDVLLSELVIQCPQEDPRRLWRVLMNWGRFADLWTYYPATSTLSLTNKAGAANGATAQEKRLPAAS